MIDDILDLMDDLKKDVPGGEALEVFQNAYAQLCVLEHVLRNG